MEAVCSLIFFLVVFCINLVLLCASMEETFISFCLNNMLVMEMWCTDNYYYFRPPFRKVLLSVAFCKGQMLVMLLNARSLAQIQSGI